MYCTVHDVNNSATGHWLGKTAGGDAGAKLHITEGLGEPHIHQLLPGYLPGNASIYYQDIYQ